MGATMAGTTRDLEERSIGRIRSVGAEGGSEMSWVRCPRSEGSVPLERCLLCPKLVSMTEDGAGHESSLMCGLHSEELTPEELARPLSLPRLAVADLMTRNVLCVRPHLSLDALMQLFVESQLKAVPVVDERGAVLGIVSEADVQLDVHARSGVAAGARTAADVMMPAPFTVPEHIPVTARGRPDGLSGHFQRGRRLRGEPGGRRTLGKRCFVLARQGRRLRGATPPAQGALRRKLPQPHAVRLPAVPTSDQTGPNMSDKGRVLIVDDEANARNALAELLRDEGYVTEVAADGQKALKALEGFDPDVVLTDLKMPVMDGLTLLEQGKPLVPHAAFVVMTAFGSIDTAVQAISVAPRTTSPSPSTWTPCRPWCCAPARSPSSRARPHDLRERLEQRFSIEQHPRRAPVDAAPGQDQSRRWPRAAPPCSSTARAAPARS